MSSSILICDDSNMARKQVLRSLPEEWKTNVQLATNGVEALDILKNSPVTLLFLDLTMPELDGIGVLTSMKEENLDVPTFVISADIQPEMQSKVMALGAKAFLRKPVKQDVLLSTLSENGFL